MAEIKQLAVDAEKQSKGVWVPYDLDVELLIAGTSSPEFRKASAELLAPHRQKIRTTGLTFDERISIIKPAIAQHLLKGWRNLTENGKTIPFSAHKALEVFEQLPDMAVFVLGAADEKEWFRKEAQKESAKN